MSAWETARLARRAVLTANGLPILPEGRFHCHVHPEVLYQLETDPVYAVRQPGSGWQTDFKDTAFGLRLFVDSAVPPDEVRVVGQKRDGTPVVVVMKVETGA